MSNFYIVKNDELYHFGVKGMKWGVRRYQNKDGSLTTAGKKRAIKQEAKEYRKELYRDYNFTRKFAKQEAKDWEKGQLEEAGIKTGLSDKQKKAIKVGAAVVATGLAVYGGYKIYKNKDAILRSLNIGKKTVENLNGGDLVNRTSVNRTSVNRTSVNKTNINKTKLKADDLSEGIKLLNKMSKDGTNMSKAIKENQFMSKDIKDLENSISNMRKINDIRRSRGMTVDTSTLADMEAAYLIKNIKLMK